MLIISSLAKAVQEFLFYLIFALILFASIRTLSQIANLFPDFVYCRPTLSLLYSYATLCILVPSFDMIAVALENSKALFVEEILDQLIQMLLTSLIIWYLGNITKIGRDDQEKCNNAQVFKKVDFERVFNEYVRLQKEQDDYVEAHPDEQ